MATDPALPGVLSTAANEVEATGETLRVLRSALNRTRPLALESPWTGSSATAFTGFIERCVGDLGRACDRTSDLEGSLRRAAKSAAQRLYWEEQERERQRRLALERARKAAR